MVRPSPRCPRHAKTTAVVQTLTGRARQVLVDGAVCGPALCRLVLSHDREHVPEGGQVQGTGIQPRYHRHRRSSTSSAPALRLHRQSMTDGDAGRVLDPLLSTCGRTAWLGVGLQRQLPQLVRHVHNHPGEDPQLHGTGQGPHGARREQIGSRRPTVRPSPRVYSLIRSTDK